MQTFFYFPWRFELSGVDCTNFIIVDKFQSLTIRTFYSTLSPTERSCEIGLRLRELSALLPSLWMVVNYFVIVNWVFFVDTMSTKSPSASSKEVWVEVYPLPSEKADKCSKLIWRWKWSRRWFPPQRNGKRSVCLVAKTMEKGFSQMTEWLATIFISYFWEICC